MSQWIEIARTGTFTDSAGRRQTFTDSDLAAIASAYDPAKRDCPLVFGHPQSDSAPAFGWAEKLKVEGGKLLASFARVPDEVKKMVAAGHYRHVSMSLMPDRKTLRHVALLGAAQPAIDCLKAVELQSGEDSITVDFSTPTTRVIPAKENDMPDDDLQRKIGQLEEQLKALKTENETLKAKVRGHKEGQEKAEGEKKEAEAKAEKAAADFAAYRGQIENEKREARIAKLVEQGKLKPAEKAGVLQFAAALAKQTETMDFAAPDGTVQKISLEEKYLRELEAREPDGRSMDFSTQSKQAANETAAINPSELTMKL